MLPSCFAQAACRFSCHYSCGRERKPSRSAQAKRIQSQVRMYHWPGLSRDRTMPRWTVGIVLVVAAVLALGGYRMFTTPSPAGDEFAQDRAPAAAGAVAFDGKRAMGYLEEICKLGPRMSGTESMTKQQELVKKHFEACGATVELKKFTASQASQKKPVDMANISCCWSPERRRSIIQCSS